MSWSKVMKSVETLELQGQEQPYDDAIFGFYRGKLEIKGDIMSPLYRDEEQEEFLQRSAAQNDRA
jgi:hypothetical protein